MSLKRKVQRATSESSLIKQKAEAYVERIRELVAQNCENAQKNKQKEGLIKEQTKLKCEMEMADVKLELAKLTYKTEYLEMTVKQQEKELEVNRMQSKEYLKSCNSLFKQNTTVAALREKQQIR